MAVMAADISPPYRLAVFHRHANLKSAIYVGGGQRRSKSAFSGQMIDHCFPVKNLRSKSLSPMKMGVLEDEGEEREEIGVPAAKPIYRRHNDILFEGGRPPRYRQSSFTTLDTCQICDK